MEVMDVIQALEGHGLTIVDDELIEERLNALNIGAADPVVWPRHVAADARENYPELARFDFAVTV